MRKSAPVRFGSTRARPPLAAPRQRIGLLGGSFNPAHAGHLLISLLALRRLGLDAVWWIVTPGNPLKSRIELAPLAERLTAARRVASDRRIVVTDFEDRLQTSFSAATIAFLRQRYPGTRFVWIIGADCLAEFHHWQLWEEIFERVPIAVVDRPGWHLRALASPAARRFARARLPETRASRLPFGRPPRWCYLTGPLSAHSSTALRARLSSRDPADGSKQSRNKAAQPEA